MEENTLLAVTSMSFDIAGLELFLPLLTGARVVIVSQETVMDGVQLVQALSLHGTTIMQATPATWRMLLDANWQVSREMKILCGGEAFPPDLARQLFDLGDSVWNLYGPTETTIWSALYHVGSVTCPCSVDGPLPIGRPIANTQIYLLDKNLSPVPIGVPGEVYIGGKGLARGYYNRPELTAEKFIPNPFPSPVGTVPCRLWETCPGERLYRTGDLARYLSDGTIAYLGRIDQQVKLRGFRIELGEIEATLLRHPAIQACAVLVREDRPGEKRLLAYCVVHQGVSQDMIPNAPILRTYMQDRLPAYMLPATFVLLDNLPLMPNGKVDRRALATKALVQDTRPTGNKAMVAPRTRIEKALAAIWTDLLHLEQVCISDNFFSLGGHSLLAVQLLNRMNKQFGLSLSLSSLFQVPTIEQAAALLQKELGLEAPRTSVAQGTQATAVASSCVPIQPVGEKRPFFWVHPSGGEVYCYLDLAKHLRHDRPFYGIQTPGLNDLYDGPTGDGAGELTPQVFSSIEEMATFYIDEILTVQPDGPYFLGGYSFGGLVAFEIARQLEARDSSVALLTILDVYPNEQDASPSVGVHQGRVTMKDRAELMVRTIDRLGWKKKVSLSYEELCRLQPDAQLAYVLDRLREAQVVPDDMDISQFRRRIQVREAHEFHMRNYSPQPYTGRITLFRSEVAEDDSSSWAPFSAEPVEVHTVASDHDSMVNEPYAALLAAQLQQCLDEADRT